MGTRDNPWAPGEVERMARLRAEGLTWRQLAQRFGRTEAACMAALRRLPTSGWKARRPITDEDMRDMAEMLDSGWTYAECAAEMGVTLGRVQSIGRKMRRLGMRGASV